MLQFRDIPIDWTDFRLMIRQTADILQRFETLDAPEYDRIQALARDGQIEAVVASWYERRDGAGPAQDRSADAREGAARSGAAAGDAAVSGALRRGVAAEDRARRLGTARAARSAEGSRSSPSSSRRPSGC